MTGSATTVRIGVCGIGSIGARHARAFAALAGVQVLAYDSIGDTRARVGPNVEVVDSFPALLDAGLDGLVVATPDRHHLSPTVAACERGMPVLLEKPIADGASAAGQIAAAAAASGTPVLLGYVLRHDPCLRRAKALLDSGAVGNPLSFHVMLGAYETLRLARNRFADARPGGLLLDYSHEWDYLRWLLGPITGGLALARMAGDLELRQDPNLADIVLRLTGGVTGTVHLDYVQDPPCRRLTVVGDHGTLVADVACGTVEYPVEGDRRTETLAVERDEVFRAQATHFLDVIARRTMPVATAADGLAAFAVGTALWQSATSGAWATIAAELSVGPNMHDDGRGR